MAALTVVWIDGAAVSDLASPYYQSLEELRVSDIVVSL